MKSALKEMLKMTGITQDEMESLLHMLGGDRYNKKIGWRNYAVLSPDDQTMAGLIKKKLVRDAGTYSGTNEPIYHSFHATLKGKRISKAFFWLMHGEYITNDLTKDLKTANMRLYNNGLDPVVHY